MDTCSACLKTGSTPAPGTAATAPGTATRSAGACDVRDTSDVIMAAAAKGGSAAPLGCYSDGVSSSSGGRRAGGERDHSPAAASFAGGVLKLLERSAGAGAGVGEGREGEGGGRRIPVLDLRREVPWKERRTRIDSALAWLRSELVSSRHHNNNNKKKKKKKKNER